MEYILHLLIFINIYIILALGSNILIGWANLLSLGQAAFYGISAYATAISLVSLGLSAILTVIICIIVCVLFAVLFSLPLLRLKDDYFILGTLGLQMITFSVFNNWKEVTKGPYGISGIKLPSFFNLVEMSGVLPFFILSTLLMISVLLLIRHLTSSPFGRILRGLRDDEMALLSLGKNVRAFKIYAFAVSAFFVSLGGFLYATYVSYIDPTSFSLDESFFILSALIIGGMGNIKGPVAGAFFIVLLPEVLRFTGLPDAVAANSQQIIFGVLLIVLMRNSPRGFFGSLKLK